MDLPVLAGDVFLAAALAAPTAGAVGGAVAARGPRTVALALTLSALGVSVLAAAAWRAIPAGVAFAVAGAAALFVTGASCWQIGRLTRRWVPGELNAGLLMLLGGVVVSAGPFLSGPLTASLSARTAAQMLSVNAPTAIAAAAGIDLLHVDAIYQTSPLAHRGVALPAWTAVCSGYAVAGLACWGVSRIRPWSDRS